MDATHLTSKHCRDFLKSVKEICHRLVMTPDIANEWNRHQSKYSRTWRVFMVAHNKVKTLNLSLNDNLRSEIQNIVSSQKSLKAMLKDCPLIEAALETDQTVVSLDETARSLFATASARFYDLRNIVWVNPSKLDEKPILWLRNGARSEKIRRLGY
ncbi:MAG: hypothetical protein QQN41_04145 [Nitrosopumilus sp.]